MELLDCVAAKFYEEPGVFKLLVSDMWCICLLSLNVHGLYLVCVIASSGGVVLVCQTN